MSIFKDIDIDHKLRLQYIFQRFSVVAKDLLAQDCKVLQSRLFLAGGSSSPSEPPARCCVMYGKLSAIHVIILQKPHGSRARFWWQQWTKQEQTRSDSTRIVTRVSDEALSKTSLEMTFKRRPRRQIVCPKPRLGLQKPAARWCKVGQQLGRQKQLQWLCLITCERPSLASHTNGRCRWR